MLLRTQFRLVLMCLRLNHMDILSTPQFIMWVGVPKGTPEEHIKVLEQAFLKIADLDETKKVKLKVGIMPIALDSESAQKLIAEKKAAWEPIVKKFSN